MRLPGWVDTIRCVFDAERLVGGTHDVWMWTAWSCKLQATISKLGDSMRNGHSNAGLRTLLDAGQVDDLNQRSSILF